MKGRRVSHYEIVDELSRGGMGVVYRAVDVRLDREVALTVFPEGLVADADRRRRFVQEARAASSDASLNRTATSQARRRITSASSIIGKTATSIDRVSPKRPRDCGSPQPPAPSSLTQTPGRCYTSYT